jgi:hypothetical protein
MRASVLAAGAVLLAASWARAQNTFQSTQGTCAPAISGVRGNVVVNCNLTKDELRINAESNLKNCIIELSALGHGQTEYLLPSVVMFISIPTKANWDLVLTEVGQTQKRLQAAVNSAIDYDAQLDVRAADPGVHQDSEMQTIHELLFGKEALLFQLPQKPPDVAFVNNWNDKFRRSVDQLLKAIVALKERLPAEEHKGAT